MLMVHAYRGLVVCHIAAVLSNLDSVDYMDQHYRFPGALVASDGRDTG
jgi:hypothetical protein